MKEQNEDKSVKSEDWEETISIRQKEAFEFQLEILKDEIHLINQTEAFPFSGTIKSRG